MFPSTGRDGPTGLAFVIGAAHLLVRGIPFLKSILEWPRAKGNYRELKQMVWVGWVMALVLAASVIAVVFWPPRRERDESPLR